MEFCFVRSKRAVREQFALQYIKVLNFPWYRNLSSRVTTSDKQSAAIFVKRIYLVQRYLNAC